MSKNQIIFAMLLVLNLPQVYAQSILESIPVEDCNIHRVMPIVEAESALSVLNSEMKLRKINNKLQHTELELDNEMEAILNEDVNNIPGTALTELEKEDIRRHASQLQSLIDAHQIEQIRRRDFDVISNMAFLINGENKLPSNVDTGFLLSILKNFAPQNIMQNRKVSLKNNACNLDIALSSLTESDQLEMIETVRALLSASDLVHTSYLNDIKQNYELGKTLDNLLINNHIDSNTLLGLKAWTKIEERIPYSNLN